MIYLDTSVFLAQLLAEDRRPPASLWSEPLVASRLVEYEVWNRLNDRALAATHGDLAWQMLARISMVELSPLVLARTLEPFPVSVRTLDALHLASIEFLRSRRLKVGLATYDRRMAGAAEAMQIALVPMP
ncbi:MAG: PIN domain-containing protein [Geminicoccales bacterium]